MLAALAAIRQRGLKLVGLHMHIGSGVDYRHLEQVCGAMVELVRTTHSAGHDLHAISAGGGLSIPYRDGEPVIDTQHYHGLWDAARQQAEAIVRHPLGLEIEPGRYLVAASGVAGTEGRTSYSGVLPVLADAVSDADSPPAFVRGPYGVLASPTVSRTNPGNTSQTGMLCTNPN